MHVLAFVNQKGGCGKTTTAVHLAGALAARGEKVLLVDLDPQAHATLALGCAVEDEPSSIDVLRDRVTLREAIVGAPGGIALVPATAELAEFEEISARLVGPEQVLALALARLGWSYEFVLLDCPPRADGCLSANALRAADTALLVVEAGAFALQGALKALAVLEEVALRRERAFALRAVGTLFDKRTRIAREILVGMQAQLGPALFDTVIRTSVLLREAPARGVPIQVLAPHSRAADDFAALAEEVVAHAREWALERHEARHGPGPDHGAAAADAVRGRSAVVDGRPTRREPAERGADRTTHAMKRRSGHAPQR